MFKRPNLYGFIDVGTSMRLDLQPSASRILRCSIRQCSGTATSTGWNFRFGRRAGETVDSELQEESGWLAVLRLVGLHDLGC